MESNFEWITANGDIGIRFFHSIDGGPRHVPMGFTSGLIVDDDFHYRKPIMYTTSAIFPNILLRVQNASAGANTEQTWM